jgi:hypothetical protein
MESASAKSPSGSRTITIHHHHSSSRVCTQDSRRILPIAFLASDRGSLNLAGGWHNCVAFLCIARALVSTARSFGDSLTSPGHRAWHQQGV